MLVHSIARPAPDVVHRPWSWKHAIIPLVWLLGIAFTVWLGFMPDGYREVVMEQPPKAFYFDNVIVWSVPITLHAALMVAILRPWSYRESWGRALAGLIPTLLLLATAFGAAMHAPPTLFAVLVWGVAWSFWCCFLGRSPTGSPGATATHEKG